MQDRLFFSVLNNKAELYYQQLEQLFEEQAYPLALTREHNTEQEISLYVPRHERQWAKQQIEQALKLAPNAVAYEELPELDWVQYSLSSLPPIRAGSFFIHGQHNRDQCPANSISIEIEASQAFGTGHHGTTVGCLELLERIITTQPPQKLLDLGTGSGILAIASAKLSPQTIIVATDIDPIAIKIAQENAQHNNVPNIIFLCAEGVTEPIKKHAPYNLIVANILAQPLKALAAPISQLLSQTGSLVLSGLLDTQAEQVLNCYKAQGLQQQHIIKHGEWVSLHLQKDH